MPGRNALQTGQDAEQLALDYLVDRGLSLVARNYRCRLGEIDLVMRDGACLVFVEVRFRRQNRFSKAARTVDANKQRKLLRAAGLFLTRNQYRQPPVVRFDVVGIDAGGDAATQVSWLKDAFRPESGY